MMIQFFLKKNLYKNINIHSELKHLSNYKKLTRDFDSIGERIRKKKLFIGSIMEWSRIVRINN